MMDIRYVPKFAIHNRKEVEVAEICSCYRCLATFDSKEIKLWTDAGNTAICPQCLVDTVLPEEVDLETLKKYRRYWFNNA